MALISGQNLNSLADEFPGVTALTMSRTVAVATGAAPTSGTLYARVIALPPGLTVNNLDYWQLTAATTPAHQWMCLMTPGGIVVAVTADNTAGQANATYYRAPVTVPFTTPPGAPSQWYIGLMLAAATTTAVAGGVAPANVGAGVPAGTVTAFATAGSGLTTPPALGAQQVLLPVAGTSANIYAATA